MKKMILAAFAVLIPMTAQAVSAKDPVASVMALTVSRWEVESAGVDYFEPPYLDQNFSKAFVAQYHAAEKYPAYDVGTTPFEYDVITSSQDGCPLQDLKIEPGEEKDGLTTVDVSFRLWECAATAEEKAKVSQVRFDVVMEGGKPLINDIHRLSEGKWDSLVKEMQDTIKARQ